MCISCVPTNATAKRGRRGFVRRVAAIGVMLLTVAIAACPVQAGLIYVDGDYQYIVEDFSSVEGPMTELEGPQGGWGTGYRVDADDLWSPFGHEFRFVFDEDSHWDAIFPFASQGVDFAIVSQENLPSRDGMALMIRHGHQDLVTLPQLGTDIVEFSCEVYLNDAFGGAFYRTFRTSHHEYLVNFQDRLS